LHRRARDWSALDAGARDSGGADSGAAGDAGADTAAAPDATSSGSDALSGATITAASCESGDVLAAAASAQAGDVVGVPAGTCTWSQTVTLTTGIVLRGAGAGSTGTRIRRASGFSAPLVEIALSEDLPVRVTAILFDNQRTIDGTDLPAVLVSGRDYGGQGTALTHVRIDHILVNLGGRQVHWTGWAYGVVDHSTFVNGDIAIGLTGDDDFAWQRAIAPGTGDAVFIEDNLFQIDNNAPFEPNEQIYHQEGARSVLRHNTFDGSRYTNGNSLFLDSHGNQNYYSGSVSTDMRGQPIREIYDNTFHAYQTYRFDHSRGGSTLIHDNAFIYDSGSAPPILDLEEEEAWQSQLFSPLRNSWPAEDQINATFVWNNTINGVAATVNDVSTTWDTNDDVFAKEGRDFWMKPPDATTCTAYPQVTKMGAALYPMRYTCITSYKPYMYPHPLVTP
jgi:hypothetical protein